MPKRTFRQSLPVPDRSSTTPSYPTLEVFDHSRRDFLSHLGAAILGAGGLMALGACGGRRVPETPDASTLQGQPQQPDARVDQFPAPDGEAPPQPDGWPLQGGREAPDARGDLTSWPEPDANNLEGDVAGPDARIDEKPDMEIWMGKARLMDARVDGCRGPKPKPTP